jgi:hypothetical protein
VEEEFIRRKKELKQPKLLNSSATGDGSNFNCSAVLSGFSKNDALMRESKLPSIHFQFITRISTHHLSYAVYQLSAS